jgi:hypothetical protein
MPGFLLRINECLFHTHIINPNLTALITTHIKQDTAAVVAKTSTGL